jgi:hypothetical protein
LAFFGALLFFLGMKNYIPKRQPKKKTTNSIPKSIDFITLIIIIVSDQEKSNSRNIV